MWTCLSRKHQVQVFVKTLDLIPYKPRFINWHILTHRYSNTQWWYKLSTVDVMSFKSGHLERTFIAYFKCMYSPDIRLHAFEIWTLESGLFSNDENGLMQAKQLYRIRVKFTAVKHLNPLSDTFDTLMVLSITYRL